jgi:hypothetical protein
MFRSMKKQKKDRSSATTTNSKHEPVSPGMKRFFFLVVLISVTVMWLLIFLVLTTESGPEQYNVPSHVVKNTHRLEITGMKNADKERYWWERKAYLHGIIKFERGVTLVLHCDVSKLYMLNMTALVWKGPITICVFVNTNAFNQKNIDLIHSYKSLKSVTIIIVSSDDTYPINILRNRAAQRVTTELAIMLDMDFIPDPGLYSYVMEHYEYFLSRVSKSVFVIPAFNFKPPGLNITEFVFNTSVRLPTNKVEVMEAIQNKTLHYEHWFEAQSATNVSHWLNTDEIYEIEATYWYEPYIMVGLRYVPLFDERFIAYGDDKAQWNRHLAFLGFRYNVLPNHFVIHIPHLPHKWDGAERRKMRRLILKWIKEFEKDLFKINSSNPNFSVYENKLMVIVLLMIWIFLW